jgi:hypothetical protein
MSRRKKHLETQLARFLRQYRRKHGKFDPNDRDYDRELEAKLKRLRPEELDELMRGTDAGEEE